MCWHRYASETPRLPDVDSITTEDLLSNPRESRSAISACAVRSLEDPAGLHPSSFNLIVRQAPLIKREIVFIGVLPITLEERQAVVEFLSVIDTSPYGSCVRFVIVDKRRETRRAHRPLDGGVKRWNCFISKLEGKFNSHKFESAFLRAQAQSQASSVSVGNNSWSSVRVSSAMADVRTRA